MASESTKLPSVDTLRREVSVVLRSVEDPNVLTFKQVRLAVEKALGLKENSLHKESRAQIKHAVHSVMDEIEEESSANNKPSREVEANSTHRRIKTEPCPLAAPAEPRGKGGAASSASKRKNTMGGEESEKRGSVGVRKKNAKSNGKGSRGGGGQNSDDDSPVCVLSETARLQKQVNVKTWKGHVQVDIREHYLKDSTAFAPTKKGITLNPAQWNVLRSAVDAVDAMIDGLKRT